MPNHRTAPTASPLSEIRTISAPELDTHQFPPLREIVPGILVEGLTLLAGRPKMGKSWLTLGLALAVASGGRALGSLPVERGGVLYLALEDGERRTQIRQRALLAESAPPPALSFAFAWPTLDDLGLEALQVWTYRHPETRLIVIDTLKRIRPRASGGERLYDLDYDAVQPLQELAKSARCAVVVVTHVRKMDADDPLDTISGSTGLPASADGVLVLVRKRGRADAILHVVSRDLAETRQLALAWDAQHTLWTLLGDAADYALSEERQAILEVLREAGEPVRPHDLASVLEKPDGSVRKLLWTMSKAGEVKSLGGGRYTVFDGPHARDGPGNSGNSGSNGNRADAGNAGNSAVPVCVPAVPSTTTTTTVTTVTDDVKGDPAGLSCPRCGGPAGGDGICWRCSDRPCITCRNWTGSALRSQCFECGRSDAVNVTAPSSRREGETQ